MSATSKIPAVPNSHTRSRQKRDVEIGCVIPGFPDLDSGSCPHSRSLVIVASSMSGLGVVWQELESFQVVSPDTQCACSSVSAKRIMTGISGLIRITMGQNESCLFAMGLGTY